MRFRVAQARIQKFENDAGALRNCYWFVRYARSASDRRKHYRRAAKEKGRLAALGWDREIIRLYGLWLRRPGREVRYERFKNEFQRPEQMTLF